MSGAPQQQLISVQPQELKFPFELEKQSYCDLKVSNITEHHVAFKVKTTSPKKYFVRPNTGVIQPWDSCSITVTLQAQREYPPDMQCKDKFLLQSTIVPPNTDVDDLSPDTFNKDGERTIDECKLRVVYLSESSQVNSEDENYASKSSKRSVDPNAMQAQHLKEERDAAVQQVRQLQQELELQLYKVKQAVRTASKRFSLLSCEDLLRRRRNRGADPGFSLTFAAFVGLIGIMVGVLLNLTFSSPSTE